MRHQQRNCYTIRPDSAALLMYRVKDIYCDVQRGRANRRTKHVSRSGDIKDPTCRGSGRAGFGSKDLIVVTALTPDDYN